MADTPSGSAPASPAVGAPSTAPAPSSAPASPATPGTPVAGTTQPGLTPAQPGSSTPGEPPQERWPDILNNARSKTRAEVEAEFRQRYAQYDRFEQDPWGAVQQWLQQASGHGVYGPMVKQWAGQYLNSLRGPKQIEEPQPDVPIVDGAGNVTGQTYSAQQLKAWREWDWQQRQQSFEERLAPIEADIVQRNQQAEYAQLVQSSAQQASQTLAELRQQPYFKDHEADIRQALYEHEEWGDNVHAAYNHVLLTKILPTLSQAEQKNVLDSLQSKTAGTTVAPGGQAVAAPQFKSFKDAIEYYDRHPDEAQVRAQR